MPRLRVITAAVAAAARLLGRTCRWLGLPLLPSAHSPSSATHPCVQCKDRHIGHVPNGSLWYVPCGYHHAHQGANWHWKAEEERSWKGDACLCELTEVSLAAAPGSLCGSRGACARAGRMGGAAAAQRESSICWLPGTAVCRPHAVHCFPRVPPAGAAAAAGMEGRVGSRMTLHILPAGQSADKLDKDEHPRWVAYLFEVDWDVYLEVGGNKSLSLSLLLTAWYDDDARQGCRPATYNRRGNNLLSCPAFASLP